MAPTLDRQVFPISATGTGPAAVLIPVALLLLCLLVLFAYILYSTRHVSFEVSAEGLRIRGDMYGRTIPASELAVAQTRVVDLKRDAEYKPVARTNGVGLPGYRSGWFRLANGDKALLFVTNAERVVYVPVRTGYAVMMSPEDPDALLRALETMR